MPLHKRTMSELAAMLAAEDQAKAAATGASKQYVPFWSMPPNSTMLVRFVADGNEDNPYAWEEKRQIRMPFAGMINSDAETSNEVLVTVPCMETWGKKCPITEFIRPWWSGSEAERELAKRYYRKPSYIMAGFVVSSPISEASPPENPIRLFALNISIFRIIKQAIMDADFDNLPWELDDTGRDFKIVKTQSGQFPSYTTSGFSFKPRAPSAAELASLEKFGRPDLSKEIGAEPSAELQALLLPLLQDSLAGRPFDNAKFGSHFRAFATKVPSQGVLPTSPGPEIARSAEEVAQATESTVASLRVARA